MKNSLGVRFLFLIAILAVTTGFTSIALAQPTVTLVATNATATIDGSKSGLLTFTRTGSIAAPLTVNYSLSGTAVKWNDYHTIAGDMPVAVTIPGGAASTIMTIVAVANTTNANPETATFTLSANSAYTIGTASTATLTITPTAPVLPTVTVTAAAATATLDGSKTGLLVFTRTGSTATALTVNYSLGGTAVKWNDYHTIAGDMPVAVTIPGGAASTIMTIVAVANSTNANPETAIFTLSANSTYTIGATNTAMITILPAAPVLPTVTVAATHATATIGTSNPGLLTFTRTGSTTAALTLSYALSGTAVKWNDYHTTAGDMPVAVTIPAGAASTIMTIVAVANTTNANPETAIFTLSANSTYTIGATNTATLTILPAAPVLPTVTVAATNATATIGTSNVGLLTFTRTNNNTAALTVNYALSGTAVKWNDYHTIAGDMPVAVIIPAGASSVTMTIVAVANTTNANPETAIFTLSTNSAYTIGTASTATITIGTSVTTIPPIASNEMDYTGLIQPTVGDNALRVISPTLLELRQLNTKAPDPAQVNNWNFVDANNNFVAPALTQFAVTANGQAVNVVAVGFKRRVFSASVIQRDLRIDNALYLQLATPITNGQAVVVTNPGGQLWPASVNYTVTADPLRYSPAIHVNQEGYVPSLPKKAMVGYYLGNLGEMPATGLSAFSIVVASSGATVFQGTLSARPDVGYNYAPLPYQNVLQADFSSFTTPGEYYLVVPGLGASLPFLIDDGIAMAWMRTYELGLYHQRSGMAIGLPFTRFAHDADHVAPAEVPSPQSNYNFTWTTIASKNGGANANPLQTAPQLASEASQLYPFVNKGTIDVSGGHFDAGDYSKYTIDCAALVHYLMFTVDAIPGAGALDNLGVPESGDGISDLLQEAKWEADYIAKLQDADGGFYFIVYPKNREYEQGLSLTNGNDGDTQVVWPKNTSATAAAVAALAQCASSPQFKAAYPATAALYLQKATLGWQFLMNAIAKYGRAGAYQKITFYGDDFTDNDEESWAACEMYLATGDPQYQAQLFAWFPDPSDPATFKWSWVHMAESYGNAIRSYAFAARTGRLQASQLDPAYLAKCNTEIIAAGDKALLSSNQTAYATSFPVETKLYHAAGWYFSLDAASDMAVAYQINSNPAYIDAIVGNMNYEGGTNPVNVMYVTGLGLKRQHVIVNQYANSNPRVLAPDGIPIGNIQASFDYLPLYGSELGNLTFPSDGAASPYPFYDRWADTWNVTTEFVTVNQARSVLALSVLVSQTSAKSTPWKSGTAQITIPTTAVPLGVPTTLSVQTPGLDLTNARIVWEARDQQPAFGLTYTISPINNGPQWVEVEVEWPDGRRVFATNTFTANSPVINWVNGSVPAGAATYTDGGDAWTWVTSNPTPYSASADHQSNVAAGFHDHWFTNATATLAVNTGDSLFAWVYLDPANPPTEVMLMWTDSTGSQEHRAYWGANEIPWGVNGTANQFYVSALPAVGQWVRLTVPASAVGLEGSTLQGMRFTLFDGRATWDVAGKASAGN
jgi:hypothetical protein